MLHAWIYNGSAQAVIGQMQCYKTETVLFKVTNNLLNHLEHHRAQGPQMNSLRKWKVQDRERHYTGCLHRHILESKHMERTCYREEAHCCFFTRKLVNYQLIRK